MEPGAAPHGAVRFGLFEADLAAGELRKRGRKVPLQEQPWQVLCALLEKPGAVVSREELQKRLWPDGTFVDFELSLNKAVNRLREALSDSPDNPRFIETLPRKGYRFIAPVGVVEPAAPLETAAPAVEAAPAMARPSARKRRRRVWIAGLAALVALLLVTGLWPPPQPVVRVTPLTDDARSKGISLAVTGGRVIYSAGGSREICREVGTLVRACRWRRGQKRADALRSVRQGSWEPAICASACSCFVSGALADLTCG